MDLWPLLYRRVCMCTWPGYLSTPAANSEKGSRFWILLVVCYTDNYAAFGEGASLRITIAAIDSLPSRNMRT